MSTMNRIDYARHAGVDRKTISRWIKAGKYIVFSGDDIDVEASDRAIALWRDSTDGRTKNAVKAEPAPQTETSSTAPDNADAFVKAFMLANGAEMSKEEASRVKENYLALLTKLEFQQKDGQLIELELAEKVLFDCFRAQRDAWLNWPSRVAPLMAADLDVPADRMTEVLAAHVHKHITSLGEPEFNAEEA
ncbi:TPA: hypothetical protein ACQVH3_005309 [Serratia marcescens]